jgi:hypothetical protein
MYACASTSYEAVKAAETLQQSLDSVRDIMKSVGNRYIYQKTGSET